MKSRIYTAEWIILLGLALCIDIVFAILNFFAVGIVINRVVNFCVGIALPAYFAFRGVKMINWKRGLTAIGGFIIEIIPIIDILPAWTTEVAITWWTVNQEKKAALAQKAAQQVNRINRKANDEIDQPLNDGGVRQPHIARAPLNEGGVRAPSEDRPLAA